MLTNVKLNDKYAITLKVLIEKAFTDIRLAEDRDTENKIMEDFAMLNGVSINSEEYNKVIDRFLEMVKASFAFEEKDEFPEDFVEQYGFTIGGLQFALMVGQVFEDQNKEFVITSDEFGGTFEMPEHPDKAILKVINGGKE